MKNILITSAGRRVSLVKAFKREIKEFSLDSKVITTDLEPELSAACHVADISIKVSRVDHKNYINELMDICSVHNIGLIVPTIDTELEILSKNKEAFNKLKVKISISSPEFIEKCRDKRKINNFFLEKGIKIPKQIDKNNPKFPIFIKPYNGSLSKGIIIVTKKEQLTKLILEDEKLMFMEYLSPTKYEEYTIDMYYNKNHILKCLVPRKRIEIRGGEISKGVTCKNNVLHVLKEKFHFIDGVIGCINVQVFMNIKTSEIFGIEINPRFGGGYPLSYQAGANFPKYLILEYLTENGNIEYFEDWKENLYMIRYDAEIFKLR